MGSHHRYCILPVRPFIFHAYKFFCPNSYGSLTIPRTFEKVSYISFVSVTAILTACFITIVATGIQSDSDLPDFPDNGAVRWKAFENHGFTETINAITNIGQYTFYSQCGVCGPRLVY